MDSENKSIKKRLADHLAASPPAAITESVWRELLTTLAPVSESYLRELLLQTGLPFDQPYAGVAQHTLDELEESLRQMLAVYIESTVAGDRARARYCRRQVIAAKDRAKFLLASGSMTPEKHAHKEEMLQWMMVWLENPEVFPAWVDARKRAVAQTSY